MEKKTLQQIADEQGVTRQAVWLRTEKGKEYRRSEKYRKYHREYQRRNKNKNKTINE